VGEVVRFPTARGAVEPFVTRRELARIMGVSERTVARWVAAGIPSETWGLRARRFQPSRCQAWVRDRAATKAAGASESVSDPHTTRHGQN
jgi:phage terminase Nu1 subunit (DNA packaging protein)